MATALCSTCGTQTSVNSIKCVIHDLASPASLARTRLDAPIPTPGHFYLMFHALVDELRKPLTHETVEGITETYWTLRVTCNTIRDFHQKAQRVIKRKVRGVRFRKNLQRFLWERRQRKAALLKEEAKEAELKAVTAKAASMAAARAAVFAKAHAIAVTYAPFQVSETPLVSGPVLRLAPLPPLLPLVPPPVVIPPPPRAPAAAAAPAGDWHHDSSVHAPGSPLTPQYEPVAAAAATECKDIVPFYRPRSALRLHPDSVGYTPKPGDPPRPSAPTFRLTIQDMATIILVRAAAAKAASALSSEELKCDESLSPPSASASVSSSDSMPYYDDDDIDNQEPDQNPYSDNEDEYEPLPHFDD